MFSYSKTSRPPRFVAMRWEATSPGAPEPVGDGAPSRSSEEKQLQEARTLPVDGSTVTRTVDVPTLPPPLPRRNRRPRPKHLLVLADLCAVSVAVVLATALVSVAGDGDPTR